MHATHLAACIFFVPRHAPRPFLAGLAVHEFLREAIAPLALRQIRVEPRAEFLRKTSSSALSLKSIFSSSRAFPFLPGFLLRTASAQPLGRPSTRSPMMLCWISLVPPAIV